MPQSRRDSRARPPGDKYGLPSVSFPSPNPADLLIIEDIPIKDGNFEQLDYGTPHPEDVSAKLTWQGPVKGTGHEKNWRTIYATNREGQDAYNFALQYAAESKLHRTWVRNYFIPRADYDTNSAAAAMQQPLTGVVSVRITAQGTGYPKNTTATISGTGTGATASVTVQRGKVVAITLTSGGTGYTGTPTVTITGSGGSGATAAAAIQPVGAILVAERLEPIGDQQLAAIYVSVVRVYKTLPGFQLKSYTQEPGGKLMERSEQAITNNAAALPDSTPDAGVVSERIVAQSANEAVRIVERMVESDGTAITVFPEVDVNEWQEKPSVLRVTTRKIVAAGTVPPQPKTAFRTATGRVWSSSVEPIPNSLRLMQTVVWSELPVAWVEYPDHGFVFPAVFRWSELIPPAWDIRHPPPWPGDGFKAGTYRLLAARQTLSKARAVYTYSQGKSEKKYREYSVRSPGVASRYFPIPNNCIHEDFTVRVYDNVTLALLAVVEEIPASTPATYDPREILVAKSEEREWHGGFYEHVLIQVSEFTSAYDFPPVYDFRAFAATALDTITQPGAPAQRLQVVSDNAADTGILAVIYGWKNVTYKKARLTLNGTTPVVSAADEVFSLITHFRLKSSALGTVTVNGIGSGSQGSIEFSTIVDGNMLTVGVGSGTAYTFRSVLAAANDVKIGATLKESVANFIKAVNLSGTAGTHYGVGTVIHPDLSAVLAEEPGLEVGEVASEDTVLLFDKIGTTYQRYLLWSLVFTGTGANITAFNNGDNGTVFATIASPAKHAYRAIDFNNPELLSGNENEADYNLPAFVNATSDEIVIASPGTVVLRVAASGSPGLFAYYQRRATGDPTAWGASVALPLLADGTVHTVTIPGTTTRIRLLVTNGNSNQARKVHADVGYIVSV